MTVVRLLILQTVVPDYRRAVFAELRRYEPDMLLAAGDEYFSPSVVSSDDIERLSLENVYLCGRRLLWQRKVLAKALRAQVVMAELNPRILSTVVAILIRRLLRRPSVLWGHVESRSGRGPSELLRRKLRQAATVVVTYTVTEADRLRMVEPELTVVPAPNALYGAREMSPAIGPRRDVIAVGRLVEAKRPLLLLRSFAAAVPRLPANTVLHLVGKGPQGEAVRSEVTRLGLEARVRMHGHTSDLDELKNLYASSLVTVSAGYVGLSVTQSLGFGVPVIYPDDEPHSPEVEALTSENSFRFRAGDAKALCDVLVEVFERRADVIERGTRIADRTRAQYSVEAMARGLSRSVLLARQLGST